MRKETKAEKDKREKLEFLYGRGNAKRSIYQTVHSVHYETVRYCDFCRKPMTRSDVNDYGTLCERCYMKEYYGK